MPSPLPSRTNLQILSQISALKFRALLIALLAVPCGFFGVRLLVAPLTKLTAWLYAVIMRQGGLPLVHFPVEASTDFSYWLPQATFLLASALVIIGFSTGVFGQARARVVMIPALLLGFVTVLFIPATSQWLSMIPSKLERDIMEGHYDEADRVIKSASLPEVVKQYLQAQIALRTHDRIALQINGEPVLKASDELAYLEENRPERSASTLRYVVQFKPEIISAIDVALNQEPQTQVGIQWQQEQSSRSHFTAWLRSLAQLASGIALSVATLWLLRLWSLMRKRVGVIQGKVEQSHSELAAEQNSSQDRPTLTNTAPPSADMLTEPSQPIVRRPAPASRARIVPHPRRRRGKTLALVIILACVGYIAFHIHRLPPSQNASGTHPCDFVGVWTASRDDSVYKITMEEDGRYLAEPIAQGPNAKTILYGTWIVRGSTIEWTPYAVHVPGQTRDINDIKNSSTSNFTLIENSGSVTRFNLIGPTENSKCKKN